jgi:hypothetical protein
VCSNATVLSIELSSVLVLVVLLSLCYCGHSVSKNAQSNCSLLKWTLSDM